MCLVEVSRRRELERATKKREGSCRPELKIANGEGGRRGKGRGPTCGLGASLVNSQQHRARETERKRIGIYTLIEKQ